MGELHDARSCHGSRCRKAFSSQASAYALVGASDFRWVAGEQKLTTCTGNHGFDLVCSTSSPHRKHRGRCCLTAFSRSTVHPMAPVDPIEDLMIRGLVAMRTAARTMARRNSCVTNQIVTR